MTTFKTQVNRRSFLKVSSAAGGGLLLGFNWLLSCSPKELENKKIPKEWFDINAYIKIADNGLVTIFSPNPEIGQNVKTSMPMIVAEELDIDWKNVIVEQAPLDTDKYTRQIAGGSQSIRKGWDSLRIAGASARAILLKAASKVLKASEEELITNLGYVIVKGTDNKVSYGELIEEAKKLEVPEEVKLKDPANYKIIGHSKGNVDIEGILNGKPLFGLDTDVEGMKTAMIIHPPAFGMTLSDIDESSLSALPPSIVVVQINTEPESKTWSDVNAFTKLVAVVGDGFWEVLKAKKSLRVNWEQVSKLENSRTHDIKFNELLGQDSEEPMRVNGSPDTAFADADEIIKATYGAPFLPHNTLEPMNFFADVRENEARLVGPVQTPENLRTSVSSLLGLSEDSIKVEMTRMGGGFGRRLYGNFGMEAAAISAKVNKPVKLVYTREDDMTQGTYRPAYKMRYRAAIKDNELKGFHIRSVGINGGPIYPNRFPAGAIENYKAERHSLESNVSTGAWRAPGSNFVAGAENSFLDELAEKMGKDPIDFRLELFDRAIQNPIGDDNDYEADRYVGVIKLVREKSNWDEKSDNVFRGFSAYYCHNTYIAQVLDLVKADSGDLKIKKVWCAVDCGIVINPDAARNQLEGNIMDGLGHALFGSISIKDGKPTSQNFNNYYLIRQRHAPEDIQIDFVENNIAPTGLGEPALPPIMGAYANAHYQATGKRLYQQPYDWFK